MTYQNDDVLDWWDDAADEHPADQVEEFSPIPPGTYECEVAEVTVEEMKNNPGRQIKAVLRIVGPSHEGLQIWDRMNTDYQATANDPESLKKAETTRRIARAQFGKLARACGFGGRPRSIQDLVGKVVSVETKNREYNERIYTDVKSYAPVAGAPQRPGNSAPAAPAKSARPATSTDVPW